MRSVNSALFFSASSNVIGKVIFLISSMFIARLLTPEEIGIFSVSAAFVALAHMVRDFGIANYIVQEKNLTSEKLCVAITITLVMAWSMAALLFSQSSTLAAFYQEEGVSSVLSVLAITFLIIPFASPTLSMLRRDMRFDSLFIIHTSAAVVHAIVSVYCAFSGQGYMSLAYGALAGVTMTWLVSRFYWRDIKKKIELKFYKLRFSGSSKIIGFSGASFGANLVKTIGEHINDIVIGKVFGFYLVGIYSRGQGLVDHVDQTLSHAAEMVALPRFSQISRNESDLKKPYLLGVINLTALQWPILFFLMIYASPVIFIMFGDQWEQAVPVAQLLCLAGVISTLTKLSPSVMLAVGDAKSPLRAEICVQLLRVVLVFIGAFHSILAIACLQVVASIIQVTVFTFYVKRAVGVTAIELSVAVMPSVLVTAAAVIPAAIAGLYLTPGSAIFSVVWGLFCLGICWIAAVFFAGHPLKKELSLLLQRFR